MAISEPKSAHLREVLLFAFNWNKSATEAHRMLEKVYSDHALSKSQCYRWFKKFQSGDFELDNEPHGKPPQKFEDAELQALLDEDSTQMQEKLAKQLQVSQGCPDILGRCYQRLARPWSEKDRTVSTHRHAIGSRGPELSAGREKTPRSSENSAIACLQDIQRSRGIMRAWHQGGITAVARLAQERDELQETRLGEPRPAPMHKREEQGRSEDCIRVAVRCCPSCDNTQITFPAPARLKFQGRPFTFDYVFRPGCPQKRVYTRAVSGLVTRLFQGYHVSVIAYGQTGSGKTYTMGMEDRDKEQAGIVPRAVEDVFGRSTSSGQGYRLNVSFVEIYNEEVRDLLVKTSSSSLTIREDPVKGIWIPGLSEFSVASVEETLDLVSAGLKSRETHCTSCNLSSSRSHAIFILHLEGGSEAVDCRMYLVDLAGSERVKKSGSTGQRFTESVKINQSLLALGNVIGGLCDHRPHVPYRDSKLTRLLQDALGGNSRTLIVACISPLPEDAEETLNTLRYAERARKIRNRAIINNACPSSSSLQILSLKKKVKELQSRLMRAKSLSIETTKDLSSASKFPTGPKFLANDLQESVEQTDQQCESIMKLPQDYDALVKSLRLILEQTENTVDILKKFFDVNPEIKRNIKIIREIQKDLKKFRHPDAPGDSNNTEETTALSTESTRKRKTLKKETNVDGKKSDLKNGKFMKLESEDSCSSCMQSRHKTTTKSKDNKKYSQSPIHSKSVTISKDLPDTKNALKSCSSRKSIYEIDAPSRSNIKLPNITSAMVEYKRNDSPQVFDLAKFAKAPSLLEEFSSKAFLPSQALVFQTEALESFPESNCCLNLTKELCPKQRNEEGDFDIAKVKTDLDALFTETSQFLDKFKVCDAANLRKDDRDEGVQDLRSRFEALRGELNEKIALVESYRTQVENLECHQRSISNWDAIHSLPYIKVSIYFLLASLIEMRSKYPSPDLPSYGLLQNTTESLQESPERALVPLEAVSEDAGTSLASKEKKIDIIKQELEDRIKQQDEEIEKLKQITVDLVSELEKLRGKYLEHGPEDDRPTERPSILFLPKAIEESPRTNTNSNPLPHFYSNPCSLCCRSKGSLHDASPRNYAITQGEMTHGQRSTPNFICQTPEEEIINKDDAQVKEYLYQQQQQMRCRKCNGLVVRPTEVEEDEETITSTFQETSGETLYSSSSTTGRGSVLYAEDSEESAAFRRRTPQSSDQTITTVITCGRDGRSVVWTKRDIKSSTLATLPVQDIFRNLWQDFFQDHHAVTVNPPLFPEPRLYRGTPPVPIIPPRRTQHSQTFIRTERKRIAKTSKPLVNVEVIFMNSICKVLSMLTISTHPTWEVRGKRMDLQRSDSSIHQPLKISKFRDTRGKQWILGKRILTIPGHIDIHPCYEEQPQSEKPRYIVKFDSSRKPGFIEGRVYTNALREEWISQWKDHRNFSFLGVPRYISIGTLMQKGKRYRFIINDHYGKRLSRLLNKDYPLTIGTVLGIGINVLRSLEFLHSHGYAHNDVQADNLLMERSSSNPIRVYLMNYSHAQMYINDGVHVRYYGETIEDYGIQELKSRDAHVGVPSRRSDLEALGFCMVHWLGATLPWYGESTAECYKQKKSLMMNPHVLLKSCCPDILGRCYQRLARPWSEKDRTVSTHRHAIGSRGPELSAGRENTSRSSENSAIACLQDIRSSIMRAWHQGGITAVARLAQERDELQETRLGEPRPAPMHKREEQGRSEDCIRVAVRCCPSCDNTQITFPAPARLKFQGRPFTFDYVFRPGCPQKRVYTRAVSGLVTRLFQGYHVSVIAYGQTGSGKTYTMGMEDRDKEQAGIVPRAVEDVFGRSTSSGQGYRLNVSFVEIYNEEVRDLLVKTSSSSLTIREDPVKGIWIPGLSEFSVASVEETLDLVSAGLKSRETHCTSCNLSSSRSHAIFILHLEGGSEAVDCRMYLVDLAGSERVKKSGSTGQRFAESVKINQSLLALGNVIGGLCDHRPHVPYRDSKLTRLLQDALGGNSRTLIVACISPLPEDAEETLNTLRYAERARKIRNRAIINNACPSSSSLQIISLKKKVKELQSRLMRAKSLSIETTKDLSSASKLPTGPKFLANDLQESVEQTDQQCESIMKLPQDYDALVKSLRLILEQTENTVDILKKFFDVNPEIKRNIKIIREIQKDLKKFRHPDAPGDSNNTEETTALSTESTGKRKTLKKEKNVVGKRSESKNGQLLKLETEDSCSSCRQSRHKTTTKSKDNKKYSQSPIHSKSVTISKDLPETKNALKSCSSRKSIYEIDAPSRSNIKLPNITSAMVEYKRNDSPQVFDLAKFAKAPSILEEFSSKAFLPSQALVFQTEALESLPESNCCLNLTKELCPKQRNEEGDFDIAKVKTDLDALFTETSQFLDKFKVCDAANLRKDDRDEGVQDLRSRFEALRGELNEKIALVESYRTQVENLECHQRSISNWDAIHSLPYIKVSIYFLLASLIEMRSKYPSPDLPSYGLLQNTTESLQESPERALVPLEAVSEDAGTSLASKEKKIDIIKQELEDRIKQQDEEIEKLKQITVDLVSELEKLRGKYLEHGPEDDRPTERPSILFLPKAIEESPRTNTNSNPLPHFYSNPCSLCCRSKGSLHDASPRNYAITQGEMTHGQRSTPNFICQTPEEEIVRKDDAQVKEDLYQQQQQMRCRKCNGLVVRPTEVEEDEETITSTFQETSGETLYSSSSTTGRASVLYAEDSEESAALRRRTPQSSDQTITTVITCGRDGRSVVWTKRDIKSSTCTILF
ncbi:KIF4A [Cordylochernes scorpioides]|uniref:KIF4A n=1 Tax=Cordylochernes scorpioides TaxID=51811 RepID=A0ABY6KMY2_9ARAC|nr:KIF4A [Cordylochernes scorpioides]